MPTQTRVSELPAITGVTGTDLLIVSSSSATKRVAISQIGDYFVSAGVAGPTGASSTVTGPAGGVGATGPVSDVAGPTGDASTVAGPTGDVGPTGADSFVAGPTGEASTITGPTGASGDSITGPTGDASNVTGPTGEASTIAGPTGDTGAQSTVTGPTGAVGIGQVYATGVTAPEPANDGEAWIDTETGKYYIRYAGVWIEFGWQPGA